MEQLLLAWFLLSIFTEYKELHTFFSSEWKISSNMKTESFSKVDISKVDS